jgi:predicted enzyme related to lactoylglutathione lyase
MSTAIKPSEIQFTTSSLTDTSTFIRGALPSWKVEEFPDFRMATVNWGLEMTGMTMGEEEHDKGRTQRTTFYFTVPNIDKEIKRLQKLGAEIHMAPVAIPEMGSYGYVKGPGDVVLGLWQNAAPPKAKVATKEPKDEATVTYFEVVSSEPKEAAAFLTKALNWKFEFYPMNGADFWYWGEDGQKFSVGLRGLEKGEKGSDVIAHINETVAKGLPDAVKNNAKKVGGVRKYGNFGQSQFFKAPGGFTMGIWENFPHDKEGGHGDDMEVEEKKSETKTKKAPAAKKGKAAAPKAKAAPKRGRAAAAATKPRAAAARKPKASPAKKAAAAKKKPATGRVTKKKVIGKNGGAKKGPAKKKAAAKK